MKETKVLAIVAPMDYQDDELERTSAVLRDSGYIIEVAAKGVTTAHGVLGGQVGIDKKLSDVNITEYKAIFFVGGGGAQIYLQDEQIHQLARDIVKSSIVLGAICLAPAILAYAGVLEGRMATVFPDPMLQEILDQCGVIIKYSNVFVDGKIITANGPEAASDFGREIVKALKNA